MFRDFENDVTFLQDSSYGVRLAWMIVTCFQWGSIFHILISIPLASKFAEVGGKMGVGAAGGLLAIASGLVLFVSTLALSFRYPLSKKGVREIVAILERWHAQAAEAAPGSRSALIRDPPRVRRPE